MSLYIRLLSSFWNHRKTAKLRAAIGDDALWIVPRLWSYAAENQPDGDFSGYTSEELATLLGCSKHATSIRQALLEAGFMDENGTLHDWHEHNGYHVSFAERAKKAADERWKRKEKIGQDKIRDKQCLEHACSIEFEECWSLYPDKSGKQEALRSYQKAVATGTTQQDVLSGINRYLAYLAAKHKSGFAQNPQNGKTWFNNKGWTNEYTILPQEKPASRMRPVNI